MLVVKNKIVSLYERYGNRSYDVNLKEPCSQIRHAILTHDAMFKKLQDLEHHPSSLYFQCLTLSALLHDIGHLKRKIDDPSLKNDRHEVVGYHRLKSLGFPNLVTEPILLHVDIKRFKATQCSAYKDSLSKGSKLSLEKQGFPMPPAEAQKLGMSAYFYPALLLRECDDCGKDEISESKDELKEFIKRLSLPNLEKILVR